MSRPSLSPRLVAIAAVMTALVFIVTSVVKVPTPAVGYVHLGDAVVFFASLAFGPWIGAAAGGLGTALADLVGGYSQWAFTSFLVHGLQGWMVGVLLHREIGWRWLLTTAGGSATMTAGTLVAGAVIAVTVGSVVVVGGYYLGGTVIAGPAAAALEVPFNTVQVLVGSVLGVLLYHAARRAYPPLAQR